MKEQLNRRILVVDDSEAIHRDFKKILGSEAKGDDHLDELKAAFFGGDTVTENEPVPDREVYEVESVCQGVDALAMVRESLEAGNPFALAFVDIRMPPGWDGLRTTQELWKADSRLQVVLCTAYSDYTREETLERLGRTESWLILKKPFDPVEIQQFAASLTAKWTATDTAQRLIDSLRRAEGEARAYASSLETVNQALQTSAQASDKKLAETWEGLKRFGKEVHSALDPCVHSIEAGEAIGADDWKSLQRLHEFAEGFSWIDELAGYGIEGEECDLERIVGRAEQEAKRLAGPRGIVLHVGFDGSVPSRVRTGGRYLERALRGLLSLACDRKGVGEVRFRVGVNSGDSWNTTGLVFTVDDDGDSPSDEQMGELLQPLGRCFETGLARRVARALDGDLSCESLPTGGLRQRLTVEVDVVGGASMLEGYRGSLEG